jgi:predicted RNA-binding Zn-ribbon protein involved in translation (DUF1610 family)
MKYVTTEDTITEHEYDPINHAHKKISFHSEKKEKKSGFFCPLCGADIQDIESTLVRIYAEPLHMPEPKELDEEISDDEIESEDLEENLNPILDFKADSDSESEDEKPIGCAINHEELFVCAACGAEGNSKMCKELMQQHGTHFVFSKN